MFVVYIFLNHILLCFLSREGLCKEEKLNIWYGVYGLCNQENSESDDDVHSVPLSAK